MVQGTFTKLKIVRKCYNKKVTKSLLNKNITGPVEIMKIGPRLRDQMVGLAFQKVRRSPSCQVKASSEH